MSVCFVPTRVWSSSSLPHQNSSPRLLRRKKKKKKKRNTFSALCCEIERGLPCLSLAPQSLILNTDWLCWQKTTPRVCVTVTCTCTCRLWETPGAGLTFSFQRRKSTRREDITSLTLAFSRIGNLPKSAQKFITVQ